MTNYGPGDVVVCVDASGTKGTLHEHHNYLVAEIYDASSGRYVRVVGLPTCGWWPSRFQKHPGLPEHETRREEITA